MIRRFGFVVLAVALIVSACGRQVTPDRVSTSQTGTMQVKFLVNGTLNFSSYSYIIVFNTDGTAGGASTQTPEANFATNNYEYWDFAIVVTNYNGSPTATPYVFFKPNGSTTFTPTLIAVPFVSGQIQLIANSNGLGTQFTVTFDRTLATFLASSTPTPTPTPTPTATPSGATPTPTPSSTPSASPSTTPTAGSTPSITGVWYFNFFTANGNVGQTSATITQLLDSLGVGGPTDATYQSPELDVTTKFDTGQFNSQNSGVNFTDPAYQIMGGDISNVP